MFTTNFTTPLLNVPSTSGKSSQHSTNFKSITVFICYDFFCTKNTRLTENISLVFMASMCIVEHQTGALKHTLLIRIAPAMRQQTVKGETLCPSLSYLTCNKCIINRNIG